MMPAVFLVAFTPLGLGICGSGYQLVLLRLR
jgi:hypothetical protein